MEQNNQQQQPAPAQPISPDNYSPLMDSVNPKPYATLQVAANPNDLNQRIPEPYYQSQTVGREDPYEMLGNNGQQGGGFSKGGGKSNDQPAINPALNNVPDEERQEGAKQMAKMIIDGYEVAVGLGNNLMMIKPAKLRKLEAAGEISLDVQIPFGEQAITPMQFAEEFNEANKDALTVSKEFKKETTPILTRVLAKRGAGVTDEQMLMYLFGKDLAIKAALIMQTRAVANDFIDSLRQMNQSGASYTPPPPPPVTPAAPTTPQQQQWTTADPNAEDFNFQNNETAMASIVQPMSVPVSDGKRRSIEMRKREQQLGIISGQEGGKKASYKDAVQSRKTGKSGRGKKPSDYVKKSEAEIANEVKLRDMNEPVDPIENSHHNKGTNVLDELEGID